MNTVNGDLIPDSTKTIIGYSNLNIISDKPSKKGGKQSFLLF